VLANHRGKCRKDPIRRSAFDWKVMRTEAQRVRLQQNRGKLVVRTGRQGRQLQE
jgi:hypothetical protein